MPDKKTQLLALLVTLALRVTVSITVPFIEIANVVVLALTTILGALTETPVAVTFIDVPMIWVVTFPEPLLYRTKAPGFSTRIPPVLYPSVCNSICPSPATATSVFKERQYWYVPTLAHVAVFQPAPPGATSSPT